MSVFCVLFTSACAYIYIGNATYWHISRLLFGYQLHYGGCASCTYSDIILYSQHPPFNKTETWIYMTCYQHGYIKQMTIHINLITELKTYMRMLGWWCDAPSFCMILPYLVLITLSQSLSLWSMFLLPDILFSLIFMFIIFLTFSMIIVQFCVWCWMFMCWVVYEWSIVYVIIIIIIACAWLFLKLC